MTECIIHARLDISEAFGLSLLIPDNYDALDIDLFRCKYINILK